MDIFTCGDLTDNDAAIDTIKEGLKAERVMAMEMRRGFPCGEKSKIC
jgi:S-adenosylmethionine/arginine decarboxylase-like enzyme